MEVILFGASKMGEIAYEKLKDNCNIVAFVDNNKNKQGAIFCGLNVYNPKILKDGNYNVIISSMYDIEIVKQLIGYGIKEFSLFEINDKDFFIKNFNYSYFIANVGYVFYCINTSQPMVILINISVTFFVYQVGIVEIEYCSRKS